MPKKTFILLAAVFFFAASSFAAPPQKVLYQGTLRRSGSIYTGNATFVFRLTDSSGATEYWTSGSTVVPVSMGLFRYPIGTDNAGGTGLSGKPLSGVDWPNITPYIEVTVDGTVLTPREAMASVPYALSNEDTTKLPKAGGAMTGPLTLSGSTLTVSGGAFSVGGSTFAVISGKVGIGTTNPSYSLDVQGDVRSTGVFVGSGAKLNGLNFDGAPAATGMTLYNDGGTLKWNGSALAVGSSVSGTTGFVPKFTDATSLGNSILFESGGNVGVGTTVPGAKLDVSGSARFGSGSTKSTFTSTGDLILASGSSVTLSGANGFITSGSSITASAFFGYGGNLTGLPSSETNTYVSSKTFTGSVLSGGSVTASAFFGYGGNLTGIVAGESNTYASSKTFNSGVGITGGDLLVISTATIRGNAFSVGASSFTVSGGSATVAYQLSAGSFLGNGAGLTGIPSTASIAGIYASLVGATFTGASGITNQAFTATGVNGHIVSAASITASAFFGYGGNLTGLPPSEINTYTSSKTFTSGVGITGGDFLVISTATIRGNAFSVGGSSFTVSGGSATVAYQLSAGSLAGNNLSIGSTDLTVSGGRVGIGTTNPLRRLDVASDGATWISGTFSGNDGTDKVVIGNMGGVGAIGSHSAALDAWRPFNINGTAMYITGSYGNVGIGTTVPGSKLDVEGGAQFGAGAGKSTFTATGALVMNSGSSITLSGGNGFIASGSSITASAFFGNGAGLSGVTASQMNAAGLINGPVNSAILPSTVAYTSLANTFTSSQTITANAFSVGGSTLVVAGGRVGIGTTNPADKLDVQDGTVQIIDSVNTTNWQLQVQNSNNAFNLAIIRAEYTGSNNGANFKVFSGVGNTGGGAAETSYIKGSGESYFAGNAGIGTTNPGAALHVSSAAGSGTAPLLIVSSGTAAGQEALRVLANGSVGIGTTSPAAGFKLDAAGNLRLGSGAGTATNRTVIKFNDGGYGNPAVNSDADGEKLVLYDSGASYRVAIGMNGNGDLWNQANAGFSWWTGATPTQNMTLMAGNLGIGTVSPAYRLDVSGPMRIAASSMTWTSMAAPPASAAGQGAIYFDSTQNKFLMSENTGGWTTFGGSAVSATGWTHAGSLTYTGDNALIQSTLTVSGNAFSVGGSTLVVSGGNVGIGTSAPVYRLDVQGDVRSTGVFIGNGSGLTNITATQMNAAGLINGPVNSSILPSTVAYTTSVNTFGSSQTINSQLRVVSTATFVSQVNLSNTLSTQAVIAGFSAYSGAHPNAGLLTIGSNQSGLGRLDFDHSLGALHIENTAAGQIRFGIYNGATRYNPLYLSSDGGGRATFSSLSSTAVVISGYSSYAGNATNSGSLALSANGAVQGLLDFDGTNDIFHIDHTENSAGGKIKFGLRTSGTPLYPLTIAATEGGRSEFNNSISTQAIFSGFSAYDGAAAANGLIAVGATQANQGRLDYASSVSGVFNIENTLADPSAARIKLRVATSQEATSATLLTLGGSHVAGSSMTIAYNGLVTIPVALNAASIGVGTSAPAYRLDVQGDVRSTGVFIGNGSGLTNVSAASLSGSPTFSTLTVAGNAFSVGGSTLIASGGNVGIGTSAPSSKLHVQAGLDEIARFQAPVTQHGSLVLKSGLDVNSGGPGLQVYDVNDLNIAYFMQQPTGLYIFGRNGINLRTGPGQTSAILIDTSQNVGVGTPTPGAALHVSSAATSATTPLFILSSGTAASQELLRVQANGNINIGYSVNSALKLNMDLLHGDGIKMRYTNNNRQDWRLGTVVYTDHFSFSVPFINDIGITPSQAIGIRPNDGTIPAGFVVGGDALTASEIFKIGSSSIVVSLDGKMGINDAGPDAQLEIKSNSGVSGFALAVSSQNDITGNILSVMGSGKVGIGTTVPASLLDVNGSAQFGSGVDKSTFSTNGRLTLSNPGVINNPGSLYLNIDSDTGGSDQVLQIAHGRSTYEGGTPLLTVQQAGNVGISTASPTSKLHVHDGDIRISTTAGGASKGIIFQDGTTQTTAASGATLAASTVGYIAAGTASQITTTDCRVCIAGSTMTMTTGGSSRVLMNIAGNYAAGATYWHGTWLVDGALLPGFPAGSLGNCAGWDNGSSMGPITCPMISEVLSAGSHSFCFAMCTPNTGTGPYKTAQVSAVEIR